MGLKVIKAEHDTSAANTTDPSAASMADPSAASTADPSAASTVTGAAAARTAVPTPRTATSDPRQQQVKKPKTKAKFKQYFGESHRSMGGGPGGEGGRAFEHSRDYRAKLDTSHAWKHVSTEHVGLEPAQVPWGITVLQQHKRGSMHRMVTESVLIFRGGKDVYNSRSEYSRTKIPRLCALMENNHDETEEKHEVEEEEIDLEEENKQVRHKRKEKEADTQPQHSHTRKKQKVVHKSYPGKNQVARKVENDDSKSKVKTPSSVDNLQTRGTTKQNTFKLSVNSKNNDKENEDPTAKHPPDPPKTADATKRRSNVKLISPKGKKQTSIFNFISRTRASSRGPGSSSNQF